MNKAEAFLAGLAILVFGLTVFGLFVYNNNQNVKRDEFYASHCKTVSTSINDNYGIKYNCSTK